jgi:hypothetical protein
MKIIDIITLVLAGICLSLGIIDNNTPAALGWLVAFIYISISLIEEDNSKK